jgi:hypothetical protein
MTGTMKIEFAALAALPPQTLIQPSPGEAAGEAGNARTLVIFMGKDFTCGAATLRLIGDKGETLIGGRRRQVQGEGFDRA